MRVILYRKHQKPEEADLSLDELREIVGGQLDVEEMICDTCCVWNKAAPVAKDRTQYHRNVFITKQIDGKIVSQQTPIYTDFFLCGYKDHGLTDFPLEFKNEIMAMFGF